MCVEFSPYRQRVFEKFCLYKHRKSFAKFTLVFMGIEGCPRLEANFPSFSISEVKKA
jgi:hypothetical protein